MGIVRNLLVLFVVALAVFTVNSAHRGLYQGINYSDEAVFETPDPSLELALLRRNIWEFC